MSAISNKLNDADAQGPGPDKASFCDRHHFIRLPAAFTEKGEKVLVVDVDPLAMT